MDFDFNLPNFSDIESFGMAKCFSSAPVGMIAPHFAAEHEMAQHDGPSDAECERAMDNQIKVDGFCFKLAPSEDVS